MRIARSVRVTLVVLVAATLALALAPVVWVEATCRSARDASGATSASTLAPEHRRNPVDTFLTYPEWSIVHAYEDLAAVTTARSESHFDYGTAIAGYWRGLCTTLQVASARGTVTGDVRTMLHVIGASFTLEMAVKGLWERTVGALTAWARGGHRTAEDRFAATVATDYAAFLHQTPWYAYPFGATLVRFWREVPLQGGALSRSIERRIALTLEWGVKAVYAKALGALAGLAPAATTIRSVVRGADDGDIAADPRITLVERRDDGTAVIETPRYRAFTSIVEGLAARGRDLVEIAGNDVVLVTWLAPAGAAAPTDARVLIAVSLQAGDALERVAAEVRIDRLCALVRALAGDRRRLEHVYDY